MNGFTCFNINEQNVPSSINILENQKYHGFWSKKQKRCYHRILSGVKKAYFDKEILRFMTLSSPSPFAVNDTVVFDGYEEELRLNKDFQVLRKRIERRFNIKIDYCKVRTNEGNGVLHVLFKGGFIPIEWLRENWEDIHDACMVDIQVVDNKPCDVARYIVSQHLAGQHGFVRMSGSWGWVYRGFVRDWKNIVNLYADSKGMVYCVALWDRWLMGSLMPDNRVYAEKKKKEMCLRKKKREMGSLDVFRKRHPKWCN